MFGFSGKRRSVITAGALGALLVALGGCNSSKEVHFTGTDITGSKLGSALSMPDTTGQLRTLADYKDKVTLVFFGFTQCPDVCPTALAQLAHTLELLGDEAAQVQVIMISVDPERDTPEVLAQYVHAFDPRFVGLTGNAKQLSETAKSFKAYYAKAPGPSPDQYSMDHASSFYVFDKDGQARILLRGDASAETIASDIRQLL
jgi:protein SCO1/2